MPIARDLIGARRPHDRLRIRRGEVAAEAERSVCDFSAAVNARATSQRTRTTLSDTRHCASDEYVALSKHIADCCVEHGVFRCYRLVTLFEAKSYSLAVCRREQDDRRSGRDVDDANTMCKI